MSFLYYIDVIVKMLATVLYWRLSGFVYSARLFRCFCIYFMLSRSHLYLFVLQLRSNFVSTTEHFLQYRDTCITFNVENYMTAFICALLLHNFSRRGNGNWGNTILYVFGFRGGLKTK